MAQIFRKFSDKFSDRSSDKSSDKSSDVVSEVYVGVWVWMWNRAIESNGPTWTAAYKLRGEPHAPGRSERGACASHTSLATRRPEGSEHRAQEREERGRKGGRPEAKQRRGAA